MPWADHKARSTRAFDDQVAWLAVHCDRSTVSELMRVSWRTVGWIVARASRRLGHGRDPLAGLRRIGIDEISWRCGQRYLIVVLDHDTGRLVWAPRQLAGASRTKRHNQPRACHPVTSSSRVHPTETSAAPRKVQECPKSRRLFPRGGALARI